MPRLRFRADRGDHLPQLLEIALVAGSGEVELVEDFLQRLVVDRALTRLDGTYRLERVAHEAGASSLSCEARFHGQGRLDERLNAA
jgi:hypothetical protein